MAVNPETSSEDQDQSKKDGLVQENGKVYHKTIDADGIAHYRELGVVERNQAQASETYKKSREKAQAEIQQGVKRVQDLFTDLFSGLPRHKEVGESLKSEWSPPDSGSIAYSREESPLEKLKKKIGQKVKQTKSNLGKQTMVISEDADAIRDTENYFKQLEEKSDNE